MGFETVVDYEFGSVGIILKHSLWDLKQDVYISTGMLVVILKHSLWDLKRQPNIEAWANECILKHSLWDLKLVCNSHISSSTRDFEALPMGFETRIAICRISSSFILKHSLWDLKLSSILYPFSLHIILKHSLWDLKLEQNRSIGENVVF